MKKKWIWRIASAIFIIVNLPVVSTTIMGEIDGDHFKYANNDASFTYVQDFDIFRNWISEWTAWGFIEDQKPIARNMEVFRLYRINPLCFWRWRYYILVSRKFNYKSWKEIEPERTPFVPDNMWQDF